MAHARHGVARIVTPKNSHRYGVQLFTKVAGILLISIGAILLYLQIKHALEDALVSLLATLMIGLALSSFVYHPDVQHS